MRKRNLVLVLLLIMLLVMSTSLMAVDYYVDPIGTDDGSHGSGPGTDAWATIDYAVDNVANPTTEAIVIYIAAGIYNTGSNVITINRGFTNLTLDGAGTTSTIIQEDATPGGTNDVIIIRGADDHAILRDMTIRNADTGVMNNSATTTMINCTISNNDNGGISNDAEYQGLASHLVMENCTISDNTNSGGWGGAISSGDNDYQCTMRLTNCTIYNNSAGYGGAIENYRSELVLINCTITENSATNYCGGIINWEPSGVLTADIYLKNTIIANNTDSDAGTRDDIRNYNGQIYDNGFNIVEISDYSGWHTGTATGDQADLWGTGQSTTPSLAMNNSGYGTMTVALSSGSIAINAGDDASFYGWEIPEYDQRGGNRVGSIDIGAYEYDSDTFLPVNLSSFYALYTGGTPTLYWTTQTEENNAYWNVYRGTTDNYETAINVNANAPVPGNGTTNLATDYVYTDNIPVVQNATYWYWIEDVSTDGETTVHDPITLSIPFEDTPITPENYGLNQNYPNPFNPSTSISFTLAEDSNVELIIYNAKGKKVKTIFNDPVYADQINSAIWNGKDASGKQVSSGIYFYKLITETQEYQKKMLLVK